MLLLLLSSLLCWLLFRWFFLSNLFFRYRFSFCGFLFCWLFFLWSSFFLFCHYLSSPPFNCFSFFIFFFLFSFSTIHCRRLQECVNSYPHNLFSVHVPKIHHSAMMRTTNARKTNEFKISRGYWTRIFTIIFNTTTKKTYSPTNEIVLFVAPIRFS